MKKILLLAAFGLLAACQQQPSDPSQPPKPEVKKSRCEHERYHFEKEALRINDRPIKVVTYKTDKELRSAYKKVRGRELGSMEELFGFSVIKKDSCTIHMIDPATKYCPSDFGHELTHCLYGEFHPSQNGN